MNSCGASAHSHTSSLMPVCLSALPIAAFHKRLVNIYPFSLALTRQWRPYGSLTIEFDNVRWRAV